MLWLSGIIVFFGIIAFCFLSNQKIILKGTILLASLFLSALIAYFSVTGKVFITFFKDAIIEVSKIIWPTKHEALQSTLVVFGFVSLMSLYLFFTDKLIEWFIFSLILGWR